MSIEYVSARLARPTATVTGGASPRASVRFAWSQVLAGLLFVFGGAGGLLALMLGVAAGAGLTVEVLLWVCAFGAIVAGAALLYASGSQVCAACHHDLETHLIALPEGAHAELLECIDAGDLALLAFLEEAPAVAPETPVQVGIEYEKCPECRESGWITPVRLRWNPKRARLDAFDCGEPMQRPARTMEILTQIAKTRAASA